MRRLRRAGPGLRGAPGRLGLFPRPPRAAGGAGGEGPAPSSSETSAPVYEGMYGPWTIDGRDRAEVALYRAGLSVSAAGAAGLAAAALTPLELPVDPLFGCFAGGLGLSLSLVHMYLADIKKVMQALFAAGAAGYLYLSMAHPEVPAAEFAVGHPWAIWLVGPLFASLTGLAFKEGMCYGKIEAGYLFFAVPALVLGHLGFSHGEVSTLERVALGANTAAYVVFAARKYTQAVKDDLGDKSVFEFQALSEREQARRLRELGMEPQE